MGRRSFTPELKHEAIFRPTTVGAKTAFLD